VNGLLSSLQTVLKPPYFYTPDIGQAQYDAGTKEGRHLPVFGDTEGETEQKEGNGKEKGYSVKQMVAKLRRLADCLENGEQFQIQIAGERIQIPAKAIFTIEHEREGNTEEVEFQFKWER
jgi:amphi-Trp domain-containing protein